MPRPLFALLLVPLFAVAAPVPKPSRLVRLYGDVSDPKGKCKFDLDRDGALTITVPKEQASDRTEHTFPRPMVSKSVTGDFTLTCRITPVVLGNVGRSEARPRATPEVGYGVALLADGDSGNGVVLTVTHRMAGNGWAVREDVWVAQGGVSALMVEERGAEVAGWVRVSRCGEEVKLETSSDGKDWNEIGKFYFATTSDRASIGPVAFQCTDQDFAVTFDQYELTELPKEK